MAELKLGYKASAEQFAPRELVELAVAAEAHGMDSATVSDHFQPWRHEGGHAPFSLAWMTAVGERTKRLQLGTSVLTPTFRYNPAVIAQAFATMGCLYPDRIFLGVGTGESLNEIATGYEGEWPDFKERYARLRESVRLMRELWLGDRVDFEGEYYHTKGASIYDVPEGGIPIYIAAGGPQVAKYAGRAGDGFICTSGKGEELYKDKLIPAMKEGAEAAGKNPDDIDRMIEIKISYDTDPELALENTRVLGAAVADRRAEDQHSRPDRDGEGGRCATDRTGRQALDRGVGPRRSGRESQGLRRLGPQPPGVPRAGSGPAPVSGALSEGPRAPAATAGLTRSVAASSSASPAGIYIAAPEGDTGKSTIALGILHRLAATVAKVGVFRPITRADEDRDYILDLLLAHTTAGLPYERCIGVTYQQLHADRDAAIDDIVERYHAMAADCDAVVIVGSDYTDVASPAELSVNARIAVNLGAPVVLAVRAKDRSVEQVVHAVEVCLAELSAQRAHTAAVVANRCEPTQLTAITEALRPLAPKTYAVPDEPLLVAPTVADLQAAVNGTLVSGDTELMSREVMGVVVAGMTADHVLERLREATAVVTPGDRSDVVLAVASAHAAEGFPSLSCIILNGGFELHRSIGAAGGRAAAAAADHRHHAWHLRDCRARWGRLAAGSPRRRCAKSTPRCS